MHGPETGQKTVSHLSATLQTLQIVALRHRQLLVNQVYRGSCLSKTWPCQSQSKRSFTCCCCKAQSLGIYLSPGLTMSTFRQPLQSQGQLRFYPAGGHCQVCFVLCCCPTSSKHACCNANMACLSAQTACCITEKLLKKAVLVMRNKVEAGLATSKQGVTLSFDSWTDVSHDQLLALAVTTSLQLRQVCNVCIRI